MTATMTPRSPKIDKVLFDGLPNEGRLFTGTLTLLGTWEVAHYLGIERSRIARWLDELEKGKQVIDPPIARLKSGPFWQLEQVRAKAQEMYRDAGAPYGPRGLDQWLEERREARAAKAREKEAAVA